MGAPGKRPFGASAYCAMVALRPAGGKTQATRPVQAVRTLSAAQGRKGVFCAP